MQLQNVTVAQLVQILLTLPNILNHLNAFLVSAKHKHKKNIQGCIKYRLDILGLGSRPLRLGGLLLWKLDWVASLITDLPVLTPPFAKSLLLQSPNFKLQ